MKSNHNDTSNVTYLKNTTTDGNQTTNTTNRTSSSTSPMHYTLYKNARFGFSVHIPSAFKKQPPPTDRDGETWTHNNSVKITAYGSYNATKDTVASVLQNLIKTKHPTYTRHGSDWMVVSGINKSGDIYYTKMFVGESKEYGLTIQYPQSDKKQYNQMVTTVANSFRPGPIKALGSVSYKVTQTKKAH